MYIKTIKTAQGCGQRKKVRVRKKEEREKEREREGAGRLEINAELKKR